MNIRKNKPFILRRDVLVCLFLTVITLAVYLQVRNHEFIHLDDYLYIAENRHIQQGLTTESVTWALTATDISYWQPMTLLSLILDYELYGLNPLGYHLTNLLLHLLNTLLLFLVLKRMTGSLWRSAFVASLFALHPLNVESVAWATERKNVLSTTFWMLTMWTYVLYVERPVIVRYVLLFLCFALGLMSKPMLVTLPFVLLLLDYWPLGRFQFGQSTAEIEPQEYKLLQPSSRWASNFRLVLEKVPLVVLSAVAIYVSSLSVQRSGIVISTETVPMTLRIANALVSYVNYIGKMFWPQKLAVFYPYPTMLPTWQIAGAGLLLIGVTLVAIWTFQRLPYLVTGWLWYLGTLLPVIGLKQVGFWPAMADRFAYVPLIGLFIMIAWGGPELVAGWRHRRVVLSVVAGAAIAALMICTWLQIQLWKNSFPLFEHTLTVTNSNYLIHNALGFTLQQQGRHKEAIDHYSQALRIKPDYVVAHNNLGISLTKQGRLEEAIGHYSKALQIKPGYADAHNNLGFALLQQGKHKEATVHYAQALRIKPDHADAHNNLGNALARQGRLENAIGHYIEALRIDSNHAAAHNNFGVALERQGRLHEAISHYSQALLIKPDYVEAHNNLGISLTKQEKFEEAIYHYSQALQIKSDYADARFQLAIAFNRKGQTEKAIQQYRTALRSNPDWPEVLNNLAWLFATHKNPRFRDGAQALQLAQKACELTGQEQANFLDTMAAAYAEVGQFDQALHTAQKAKHMALASGQVEMAKVIEKRMQLYEAGEPYYEGSSTMVQ